MIEDHKLVVVGGGVAGLEIATRLAGKKANSKRLSVTLIDREAAYVWKPMLHTIAAGTADAGLQETVFAALALTHGFRYEFGEAIAIDRKHRTVSLDALRIEGEIIAPERQVSYDTLVLSVGSRANDFGTPGVSDHCMRIDTRSDAIGFNDRLRVHLIRSIVLGKKLRVGIVGGGATGVELAAELIQVATVAERYGMSGASAHLEVILVESGPRLLGPFPERVADAALEKLKQLGVIVRVGKRVSSVNENAFMLNGNEAVDVDLKIWAAGVKAPPLMDTLTDLERTRSGQLVVGPTLRTLADDHIYALGDCASPQLPGRDMPVPTTAQAASQHARFLSRHLPGLIAGKTGPVASYKDFGSLVALGGYDAYGTLGRFGFYEGGFIEGRIAQLGHAMLYRRYQASLHGIWRGTLLWLLDTVGRKVRPRARLS